MNRIGIDIGGTFTDIVLENNGQVFSKKLLTTSNNPEIAALNGINYLLFENNLKLKEIDTIIHGTTLAANALIERKGAKTAFITTKGFRDVLEMRYEKRFDQYDLNLEFPEPLVSRDLRICVNERCLANGEILKSPSKFELGKVVKKLIKSNIEAVAIGFLHSYLNPSNEKIVAKFFKQNLPKHVTICQSSEISPEDREYERFSTTVANAYIRPVIINYINLFNKELLKIGFKGNFFLLSSSGGLINLEHSKKVPIRLIESGPAGGIILAKNISKKLKDENTIALDIGGTTAKICFLTKGEPQITRRLEVARAWKNKKGSGLPLKIPAMDLIEIGAGGGSIARSDLLGRLIIGPESSGANPGPACYNKGGKNSTITDANLILGRISRNSFADGIIKIDKTKAQQVIKTEFVSNKKFESISWASAGIIEISEQLMADALRIHGLDLGKNITDSSLVVSGGGGPIHATGIADKLEIKKIIVPYLAGVGSALGFLDAPVSYQIAKSIVRFLSKVKVVEFKKTIVSIKKNIFSILKDSIPKNETLNFTIKAELRYRGQGNEISIDITKLVKSKSIFLKLKKIFVNEYEKKFGFSMPKLDIELMSIIISGDCRTKNSLNFSPNKNIKKSEKLFQSVFDFKSNKFIKYKVFEREGLPNRFIENGPCLIKETQTTTIVPPGWQVTKHKEKHLILTKNTHNT